MFSKIFTPFQKKYQKKNETKKRTFLKNIPRVRRAYYFSPDTPETPRQHWRPIPPSHPHSHSFLSQHVGDVHRHFVHGRIVELLDIFQRTFVFFGNEIDSHTFATETSTASDTMNIIFTIRR